MLPSRLLLSCVAAVALANACSRSAAPASPPPAPPSSAVAATPAAVAPAPSAAAEPDRRPTAEEVAAIEHPHVAK